MPHTDADQARTEVRDVRSADPSLSDHANRLVTVELREVVGRDRVEVPAGRPDPATDRHGTHTSLTAAVATNRIGLVISILVLLVTGGTFALVTGSWWVLVGLVALHALATMAVLLTSIGLLTETEHLAPSTTEVLEGEGVADPDRMFTDLVQEFSPADGEHDVAEVVSGGHNRQTGTTDEDPARAAVEQRTTITPGSEPTEPVAGPLLVPAAFVVGASVIAVVAAALQGGAMWVLAAIVLVAALGWSVAMVLLPAREGADGNGSRPMQRAAGDRRTGARRRVAPIMLGIVLAVTAVSVLVGVISEIV